MAPTTSSSSSAKRGSSSTQGRGRGRGRYWHGSHGKSQGASASRVGSRTPSTRASQTPARDTSVPFDIHSARVPTRSRTGTVTPAPQHGQFRSQSVLSQSVTRDTTEGDTSGIHEGGRDEDLDALNEVVMAVEMRNNATVGCAYYVARDEVLYLMQDAQLGGKEMIDLRGYREPLLSGMSNDSSQAPYRANGHCSLHTDGRRYSRPPRSGDKTSRFICG